MHITYNACSFFLSIFMTWVYLTIFAALMQCVRYSAQKQMGQVAHPLLVSWVRFAFGLPFALMALLFFVGQIDWRVFVNQQFIIYMVIIAISQLAATFFAVQLLGRRNFAIGSTMVKCEAIFVAIFGAWWFAELLSPLGWLAVALGLLGVIMVSMGQYGLDIKRLLTNLDSVSALLGLLAGSLFAVASIFIRQASMLVPNAHAPILLALLILTFVLIIQTVIGFVYLYGFKRHLFAQIVPNARTCIFIGLTSVLGSFGWFSAYTLQKAAYVKTLGNIEIVFTLLITWHYFREKVTMMEYSAILLIIMSSLIIIWL